jgi:ParB-like chromosome segregation protein Spo0J
MSALAFHPLADIFPLVEGAEFDELVADIREHGLHEPIVIFENMVLDGRNRLRACEAAGIEPTFTVYTGDDPVAYVVSLNLRRRHLSESQRAMVAAKLATLRNGQRADLVQAPSIEGAAQLLNVGHASVERAKAVQRAGAPELVQAVERGAVSVSAAADIADLPQDEQREIVARGEQEILQVAKRIRFERGEARRARRIANLIALSNRNAPFPDRRYPVIYADPPWQYEHPPFGPSSVCENFYPTMALEDICALPIADLATPDALLFLWVPAPLLFNAGSVIDAWDFRYRTNLVWDERSAWFGFLGAPAARAVVGRRARRSADAVSSFGAVLRHQGTAPRAQPQT